ncbi:odorant receptor 85b isoform X1 [Cryptotermes secundus]|uniref:odorant receptor 85b isoform X1 n=1 Tax=Cryptotermes secundus TaxID=105785 RepID=UPI000CD7C314|nr:odorant receptor 85b isoform X1 [Cryptotermes secundus]
MEITSEGKLAPRNGKFRHPSKCSELFSLVRSLHVQSFGFVKCSMRGWSRMRCLPSRFVTFVQLLQSLPSCWLRLGEHGALRRPVSLRGGQPVSASSATLRSSRLRRFVDHLNKIVSLVTFLKVLNFPLLLCMTGFQMMQNYGDQNQFLKFASLFIGSIFLIAGYCWFGQQVIDESEKVQLAFYSTEWYSQTAGYKSLLPLAIMRASRPVTVKAGVFFDMSFLTLASLVNASYRFMTMLIQLNDS